MGHTHRQHDRSEHRQDNMQNRNREENYASLGPHLRGHLVYELVRKGFIAALGHGVRVALVRPFCRNKGSANIGKQQESGDDGEGAGRQSLHQACKDCLVRR